jgi:carnitine-CoA ligase
VASVLRASAARHPDRPFLVYERAPGQAEQTSWAELGARADRTAGALHRLGVRPGDRVSVHLGNVPEFYDLWFGAALLGAAIVPSHPLSTAGELGYLIGHAGCRLAVTQPDLLPVMRQAAAQAGARVISIDQDWVRPGDRAPETPQAGGPRPQDVLGVLYTSGTTSRPKGVLVTHAAYLHAGDVVAGHLRLRPEDRNLVVLPLFHGNAQYCSTMSSFVTGASVALTPKFSASRWSGQAAALGATVASLFAAPIRMILAQAPSPHDAAHRLRVTMFAQNVTEAQLAEFERRFRVPLIQLYGMTETVAPSTMNPLYGERRGLSIGRPLARLRVAGPGGSDAAQGELLVHGEPGLTLMAGYLDNPEATRAALDDDGWLHTGDTVRAGADGYLYFVDRDKDLIKRAGENVASTEVERVLNEHPAVFESAVVGIPDPIRDQAIHAVVVLHHGATLSEDELIGYCRERLAKFKVPDSVEFAEALPRTSVGKIRKHVLRPQAMTPQGTKEGPQP